MDEQENKIDLERVAINRINAFFSAAIRCYGKEIGLYSDQFFGINQICAVNNDNPNERRYSIQYGFPQSGGVFINFSYSTETNGFTIIDVSVNAPSDDVELAVTSFSAQTKVMPEAAVGMHLGADMQTVERVGLKEIGSSVNALQMLELATSDLQKAQILGNCYLCVPQGSESIPCVDSHRITEKLEDNKADGISIDEASEDMGTR